MMKPMDIEVFSDPVCPWCFIGKRRLERALAERPDVRASIRWRTFQLNPTMPPGGMPHSEYLQAKFGSPNPPMYETIRAVGESEGIEFAFEEIQTTPNTIDAHRLTRFAGRSGAEDAMVEALFQAYFLDGQDIGNREILSTIAKSVGLDQKDAAAHLAGGDDLSEVHEEDLQSRRLGIQGVPCFIVAGKYAVAGAQEPEAFLPLFDMAREVSLETEPVT